MENNTFNEPSAGGAPQSILSSSPSRGLSNGADDGGRQAFVEDEDVRVVVVRISEGRIADWKGGVKDWVLAPQHGREGLVNGV